MTPEEQAWRDLYDNMMLDIQNGGTTRERLERIRYYADKGDLDKFIQSGINVDNDLTYLHQSRYRDIIQNLSDLSPGEERQKAYHYYQNEIATLKSWGLLKDLTPSVDKELADLGLEEDKPLLRDAVDTATNWWDGRKADESEIARAQASGDPNWLAAAQEASANNSPLAGLNPAVSFAGLYKQAQREVYGYNDDDYKKNFQQAYTEPPKISDTSLRAQESHPLSGVFRDAYQAAVIPDHMAYDATFKPAFAIASDVHNKGWTQSELGKKWREHPAAALTEGALAGWQAIVPLEGVRPTAIRLAETGAGKIAEGAGKMADTMKRTDIYGGLEPALAGEVGVKDSVFDNVKPNDNRMEITITKDPDFYRGLAQESGSVPPETISGTCKEKLQDKIALEGTYTASELKQHSQVLGKEMELSGVPKVDDQYEAHHLFPIGDFSNRSLRVQQAAAYIKKAFDDCNMPYDCAANGFWLPGKSANRSLYPEKATTHCGAPSDSYILISADMLKKAKPKSAEDIAFEAQRLREQLLSGELEINRAGPEPVLDRQGIARNTVIGITAGQLNNPQIREDAANTQPKKEQAISHINASYTAMVGMQSTDIFQLSAATGLTLRRDNREETESIPLTKESKLDTAAAQPLGTVEGMGARSDMEHVLMIIRRQEAEIARLQKEREQYLGEPLTRERAEQLAKSDYVKGEYKQLAQRTDTLACERDQLQKDEIWNEDYFGRQHGAANSLWKYVPDMLKSGARKAYEYNLEVIEKGKEELDRREAEIAAKTEKLQERLQAPEARTVIEDKIGQYMKDDAERLAKLGYTETKITEAEKTMRNDIHQAASIFGNQGSVTPEQSLAALQRITDIMEVTPRPDIPGVEKLRINEAREYRLQAKTIIEREGCWPGRDADVEIAIKMRSMGYPRDNISMGISQASPEKVNMPTLAQSYDYGRSIVSQVEALGYGPPKPGLHL